MPYWSGTVEVSVAEILKRSGPIPRIELRDEGRFRLFGENAMEVETPVALPTTSFDPVVWAWRPWSVWWVRAPGYAWQRVTIDHSADAGSLAVGLVRVEETKPR
jgi:hypothetical protein